MSFTFQDTYYYHVPDDKNIKAVSGTDAEKIILSWQQSIELLICNKC